jgi:hypothetical protein
MEDLNHHIFLCLVRFEYPRSNCSGRAGEMCSRIGPYKLDIGLKRVSYPLLLNIHRLLCSISPGDHPPSLALIYIHLGPPPALLVTLTKSALCTSSFHSRELGPLDFPSPGASIIPTALRFWIRCVVSTACSMLAFRSSRRRAFQLISSSTPCFSFRCVAGARVPAETLYCFGSARFRQSEHRQ